MQTQRLLQQDAGQFFRSFLLTYRPLWLGVVLCLVLPVMHSAQTGNPQPHRPPQGNANFFEISQALEAEIRQLANPHSKGTKHFYRWKWFWEQRVDSLGRFPSEQYYREAVEQLNTHRRQVRKQSDETGWLPVGPEGPLTYFPRQLGLNKAGRTLHICFHPSDPNTFWISVASGGVWKTRDGGTNWAPLTDELPLLAASGVSVDYAHPDTMYLASGNFSTFYFRSLELRGRESNDRGMGILRSYDGGLSWEETGLRSGKLCAVISDPDQSGRVLTAGSIGIQRSEDYGRTWEQTQEGFFISIRQHPEETDLLYAVMLEPEPGVYVSRDFGDTWSRTGLNLLDSEWYVNIELAISPSNPDVVYVCTGHWRGTFDALYRTQNAGETWETMTTADSAPNYFGWYDGVSYSDDERGGASWALALWVDPEDADRVFMGSVNLWGSEDGGRTFDLVSHWLQFSNHTLHADMQYIAHNPLDGKIYVCHDGGVDWTRRIEIGSLDQLADCYFGNWDSTDSLCYEFPTSWQSVGDGLYTTEFYRLGLSRNFPDYVIGGTQDNATFYLSPIAGWRNIIGGDGMEGWIDPYNPRRIIGSSQFGRFRISDDGGETLRRMYDEEYLESQLQVFPWIAPLVMEPGNPDAFYAGYRDIWYLTDDGFDTDWDLRTTFNRATAAQEIRSIAVAPSRPSTLYFAQAPDYDVWQRQPVLVNSAHLWRSRNRGADPEEITAGLPDNVFFNAIAVDDDDPEMLWVACSHFYRGRKVYRSRDGGETWENVSGNLPNLPVNTLVHQEGSEYDIVYVGTDRGVYYTANTLNEGREWRPLVELLPNVIINELEIQPRSRELFAATWGRGIWKTSLIEDEDVAIEVDLEERRSVRLWRVSAAPNPGTGRFRVIIQGETSAQPVAWKLYSVTGQRLDQGVEMLKPETGRFSLDLSGYPPGVYFCRFSQGRHARVLKLIIDR